GEPPTRRWRARASRPVSRHAGPTCSSCKLAGVDHHHLDSLALLAHHRPRWWPFPWWCYRVGSPSLRAARRLVVRLDGSNPPPSRPGRRGRGGRSGARDFLAVTPRPPTTDRHPWHTWRT